MAEPRRETIGTNKEILVLLFGFFGQQKKPVTRIVQTIDEARGGPVCMSAPADRHKPFFDFDGHSLVKDETFALPMLVSELLLIGHDSAVQLIDRFESVGAE